MEREGRASVKAPLLDHGSERGIVKHPFPMNYILKPWKLGQWVYQVIKFGIVQYVSSHLDRTCFSMFYRQFFLSFYHGMHDEFCKSPSQMIIKAFTAISAVILEAFDVYCEGDFKWNCGYVTSYEYF